MSGRGEPNFRPIPGSTPAIISDSGVGCRLLTTEVHIHGVGICTPTRDEYLRFLDGRAAQIRGEG